MAKKKAIDLTEGKPVTPTPAEPVPMTVPAGDQPTTKKKGK